MQSGDAVSPGRVPEMTRPRCYFNVLVGLAVVLIGSCRGRDWEVSVYLSTDQAFAEPILRDYERQSGVHVRAFFDQGGTRHARVIDQIVAEANHPQADVLWSGDPVQPYVLIKRDLVYPFRSPNALSVPRAFKADDGTWTGIGARASVLLVNKNLVKPDEMPRSLRDIADPRWRGLTAIANPAEGTTIIHLAALANARGSDALKKLLNQMKTNGTRVAKSNREVMRLVSAGEVAFGLADTDDAAEALHNGAPIQVVYPDQEGIGAPLVPTALVLLKGPHREEGQRLIHFLLSSQAEQRLVDLSARIPLRRDVSPSQAGTGACDIRTMKVDYAKLADTLERIQPWLREWAGL